ncbi:hypothetical protein F8388_008225, partial [Cannabis sativa]
PDFITIKVNAFSISQTLVQDVVLRNGGLRVLSFVGEHIDSIRNLKHLSYLNELKKLWIWEEGDGARSAYNQILTSSKIENAQSEENVSTAEVSANSLEHHDEQLEL